MKIDSMKGYAVVVYGDVVSLQYTQGLYYGQT